MYHFYRNLSFNCLFLAPILTLFLLALYYDCGFSDPIKRESSFTEFEFSEPTAKNQLSKKVDPVLKWQRNIQRWRQFLVVENKTYLIIQFISIVEINRETFKKRFQKIYNIFTFYEVTFFPEKIRHTIFIVSIFLRAILISIYNACFVRLIIKKWIGLLWAFLFELLTISVFVLWILFISFFVSLVLFNVELASYLFALFFNTVPYYFDLKQIFLISLILTSFPLYLFRRYLSEIFIGRSSVWISMEPVLRISGVYLGMIIYFSY